MNKKAEIKKIQKILISSLIITILVSGVAIFFGLYILFFYSKIYPEVYVNSINIGGLTYEKAIAKLKENIRLPEKISIIILYPQVVEYQIPLESFDAEIDYQNTINEAFLIGRQKPFFAKKDLNISVNYDRKKLEQQMNILISQSPNPPERSKLFINNDEIFFVQATQGWEVSLNKLESHLLYALQNTDSIIQITPDKTDPALNHEEREMFLERGRKIKNKSLILQTKKYTVKYEGEQLLNFLNPKGGFWLDFISPSLQEIENFVNISPKNPVFVYKNERVEEFSPAEDGIKADLILLSKKIIDSLTELEKSDIDSISIDIPVIKIPPTFATEDVNNLGIKELIGVGTSSFKGSISSRAFNIAHAASKINGALIKPGETFSLVDTIGDISSVTGYKQAYIIQGNKTILGDGGGVCQVSTTLFRAALNAGLPIKERHPHSYRVTYYEQDSPPGIDATVYHPSVDLKIVNDTTSHILIQSFVDSSKSTIRVELYGTKDGRIAIVDKPVVSSLSPPPDDLYIDEPALPAGEIKQVDFKAWGAKVYFDYKVEKDGKIIFEKRFYSNYQPWQAKYLRGISPVN